jgi:methylglutamate dehydrogenase subunit B
VAFRLPCPTCGERPVAEFSYVGPPTRAEPMRRGDDEEFAVAWLDANIAGIQEELWFHWAGCGRIAIVRRDTRTNRVPDA